MKTTVIIGSSKGIGYAIMTSLLSDHKVVNISRTPPQITHENLEHYSCNVLTDTLPDLKTANSLLYCPGSINLKPISRLSLDDFREVFEMDCGIVSVKI